MAVARPQAAPAGSSTGLMVATIVFAVVAVLSLTLTVLFLTQKADLIAAADQQRQRSDRAEGQAREAVNDLRLIGAKVLGEQVEDRAQIEEEIARALEPILADASLSDGGLPADVTVVELLDRLYIAYADNTQDLAESEAELQAANAQLDEAIAAGEERAKAFDDQVAELQDRYDALQQESESFRTEANDKIGGMEQQRAAELEGIAAERDTERQLREGAEEALTVERERNDKLAAQLAEYKPSGEHGSVLQIQDGTVLRAVSGNEVVYIDLGKRDGVRPGMTFSVYSPIRGIPADGKGKATIEITDISETTSQCQVTTRVPADPVLKGDVVANPVFDRARQFSFAVAGDFDLDFDGNIEDPDGQEVVRLIQRWGGNVVNQVDTRTDFLVLGAAPAQPLPVPKPSTPPVAKPLRCPSRSSRERSSCTSSATVCREMRTTIRRRCN